MPKVTKSRNAQEEQPWSDAAGGRSHGVVNADANNFNVMTSTNNANDQPPLGYTNVPSLPPIAHVGGGRKEDHDSKMPAVAGGSADDGGQVRS